MWYLLFRLKCYEFDNNLVFAIILDRTEKSYILANLATVNVLDKLHDVYTNLDKNCYMK